MIYGNNQDEYFSYEAFQHIPSSPFHPGVTSVVEVGKVLTSVNFLTTLIANLIFLPTFSSFSSKKGDMMKIRFRDMMLAVIITICIVVIGDFLVFG